MKKQAKKKASVEKVVVKTEESKNTTIVEVKDGVVTVKSVEDDQ